MRSTSRVFVRGTLGLLVFVWPPVVGCRERPRPDRELARPGMTDGGAPAHRGRPTARAHHPAGENWLPRVPIPPLADLPPSDRAPGGDPLPRARRAALKRLGLVTRQPPRPRPQMMRQLKGVLGELRALWPKRAALASRRTAALLARHARPGGPDPRRLEALASTPCTPCAIAGLGWLITRAAAHRWRWRETKRLLPYLDHPGEAVRARALLALGRAATELGQPALQKAMGQ